MKANELRIRNLIQWYSTGNIEEVKDIVTYDKRQANINNVSISDCLPITLTEEWLLKLGFDKYDDGGELKGNDCFYGIKNTGIIIGLTPRFNLSGYKPAKKIKYVHQLQNLYFALTGEELTIK